MRISVRLFAGHRERAGTGSIEIDAPNQATVAEAFVVLIAKFPQLAETDSFTTFAVNREVVDRTVRLKDGDELTLLQPVSGG